MLKLQAKDKWSLFDNQYSTETFTNIVQVNINDAKD